MKLKEFIEQIIKESPISFFPIAEKLIKLEAIEQSLNLMYGVEFDIEVKPAPRKEGRFWGQSLIKKIEDEAKFTK